MSALTVDHQPDHGYGWDDLVRLWEESDRPEGCKVEIIEGIITVSPPPSNRHNCIAAEIQRLLYKVIPEDWGIHRTQGVSIPRRRSLYIPDLAGVPMSAVAGPGYHIPASEVALAVEITSPCNAGQGRISKPAGYAQAGVPLYLLVDAYAPGGPTVTLHGEPKDDVHRVLQAGKFGDRVHLPDPFELIVDTGDFPVS